MEMTAEQTPAPTRTEASARAESSAITRAKESARTEEIPAVARAEESARTEESPAVARAEERARAAEPPVITRAESSAITRAEPPVITRAEPPVIPRADIQGPDQVALLVETFYQRVYADEVLRPIFADVARVNLEDHLPKMNRFWNTVLFGVHSYRGNPMETHVRLNRQQPLHECHFVRWLSLWRMTVDALFSGPVADRAKASAERINSSIASNLKRYQDPRKEPIL